MTCSGGAAAMDMMLELIAGRHGPLLAGEIAEQFMTYRPRNGSDRQRMSLDQRTGIRDRRLLNAIAAMESRLEDPLQLSAICAASDLSPRHLQRLCLEQLGKHLQRLLRVLRLKHARNLLLHGSESILGVATACGYRFGVAFQPALPPAWAPARATTAASGPARFERTPRG